MIDVAALGSLLVEIFGAAKEWSEPKIVVFDPLEDAEREKIVEDGWTPVVERDLIGRPSVFMDRLSELILVHRL